MPTNIGTITIAPPPKDTAFIDSRGRITTPWVAWLESVTAAGTIIQNLSVLQAFSEDDSTSGPPGADGASGGDSFGAAAGAAWNAAITGVSARCDELQALIVAGDPAPFGALGSAAFQPVTAFDAAGAAAAVLATSLQKAANLSDLASAPTARTNLGAAGLTDPNVFNAQQKIKTLAGYGQNLLMLDTGATGQQCGLALFENGALLWEVVCQPDNTFLVYDAAHGVLLIHTDAGGNLIIGAPLTTIPALSVTGPLTGALGGYANYTPTLSATSPFTATIGSGTAEYIRVGPTVHFSLAYTATLGGTMSNLVLFTLPVATAAANPAMLRDLVVNITTPSAYFVNGFAYAQPGGSNALVVYYQNGAPYPGAGAYTFYISGSYRVG